MIARATIVHHVYADWGDLLPLCGVIPGPGDPGLGRLTSWNTGHDPMVLRAHSDIGGDCCMVCLEYAVSLPSDESV